MSENDKTTPQSDAPADSKSADSDAPVASELQINRNSISGGWFRWTPHETLILLVMFASIFGLLMIRLEYVSRLQLVLMVGCFAFMVWKRSGFALACLFTVLGWLKFTVSFRSSHWFKSEFENLHTHDFLFTVLVLAFAGACFRFLETRKYCLGVLSKFGWGGGVSSSKKTGKEFPSLLGGRWWLIPFSIVAASFLLGVFPIDNYSVQKYWIKAKPMRLIFLMGALFLIWFVFRSFFMLVMRWKMDPDQAGVHVRSVYAKEFWREHRAIEARRAKAISKRV